MSEHPHAHHHHPEGHFTGGELVRDTVLGMADGLTVPFALAAGLTGAIDSAAIIVTAGAAEIAAGWPRPSSWNSATAVSGCNPSLLFTAT